MSIKPHMSASQYKRWMACPAKELAVQSGLITEPPPGPPLIGGKIFDKLILSPGYTITQARADYPEIVSTRGPSKGDVKSVYAWIEPAAARIQGNAEAMAMVTGQTHIPVDFHFAGSRWIGEIDCLPAVLPGFLVDLKSTKDFHEQWVTSGGSNVKLPFYEAWQYWLQMAVYWHALGRTRQPAVLAVTKQMPRPRMRAFYFDDEGRLAREMWQIEKNMPAILSYKSGDMVPPKCSSDDCDYCQGEELTIERAESLL